MSGIQHLNFAPGKFLGPLETGPQNSIQIHHSYDGQPVEEPVMSQSHLVILKQGSQEELHANPGIIHLSPGFDPYRTAMERCCISKKRVNFPCVH